MDGKERILPVLREVEATTQQIQELTAQNQQLQGQVDQLNETLDGYASIVSSSPGSQDALQAMGGGAEQMQV